MIPLLFVTLALAAPIEPAKVEVQDLVLLHEDGPLRLRLNISDGDKSVFARWHAHVEAWFKYADRDRDNFIGAEEFERVPSVMQMQYMLQNGQFYAARQLAGQPGGQQVKLKDVDADGDGKIDRRELIRYYVGTAAGPLLVQPGYSQVGRGYGSSALSDSLFRGLDVNRDGRLSPDEIRRAGELLNRFDIDDNEIVTAVEISGGQFNQYVPQTTNLLGLIAVPREANDLRITTQLRFARELIARLDTDKNGTLDAKEHRIDPSEFEACDANRDGQLDALEMAKWVVLPPHLTVGVRMDQLFDTDRAIDVKGDKVEPIKDSLDSFTFRLRDATIQFDRVPTPANVRAPVSGMARYMTQQFNAADKEKTGRLSIDEINKHPQTVYLRTQSEWLDLDGDGFITLAEIEGFNELASAGMRSQMVIGFLDQGRWLFEILDTKVDATLSIGELKNASKALATYLKKGKDSLDRTDLPRRYQLVVAHNMGAGQVRMPGLMENVMVRPVGGVGRPGAVARTGPGWYQKMDVNGDSYISPREFLGPMTAFNNLDVDGDGLIDEKEATAYDAERKEQGVVGEGLKPERLREAPVMR